MSVDLTEVLERTSAPPMGIDPYVVLHRGQHRRARRRNTGIAAITVVVAALCVSAAAAHRPAAAPPTPATSGQPSIDCMGSATAGPMDISRGSDMPGRPWLDSGVATLPGFGQARVQVNTGTCDGLELGLMTLANTDVNEQGMASTTGTDTRGLLWQTTVSGDAGPRRRTIAAVVLPDDQSVCGFVLGKDTGAAPTRTVPADTVRTTAGEGWHAEFQVLPNVPNPQGATARICSGARVTVPNLRQVSHIDGTMDPLGGSRVAQEDGSFLVFDRNGTLLRTEPPSSGP